MKKQKGGSFVAIMIFIAFAALFLRFAVGRIVKINIIQNESAASASLKLISAALENYAKDKAGVFPESISFLVNAEPAYLETDYTDSAGVKGYIYECPRLEPGGYSCVASPVKCNFTGRTVYTVTTAGVFVLEDCAKRD